MSALITSPIGQRAFLAAVVPAAGLGTRFLPTTKTVPKELLLGVDTPAIEYVADEAAQAGAQGLVLVVSPGKESVAAHLDPNPDLEAELRGHDEDALRAKVRRAPELIRAEGALRDTADGGPDTALPARSYVSDVPVDQFLNRSSPSRSSQDLES
jgi:UTP--glucose-1-phosphate uridylyltransferase